MCNGHAVSSQSSRYHASEGGGECVRVSYGYGYSVSKQSDTGHQGGGGETSTGDTVSKPSQVLWNGSGHRWREQEVG
jgi:hypothetical protein